MEVILRKTKITGSILNQCRIATIKQLCSYDILGFCIYKDQWWIVMHDYDTFDLKKFQFFTKAEAITRVSAKEINFTIKFNHDKDPHVYNAESDTERNELVEKINNVRKVVLEKGQFYI